MSEIEIHEAGAGSPLVLLHGVGANWRVWQPLIARLAQHHRVIALNLPGHPGGVPLPGDPTVSSITDALCAQLQARGIDSAHVVGNSLGGWIAVELARRGFARSVTALSPAGAWADAHAYRDLIRGLSIAFLLAPLIYWLSFAVARFAAVRRALLASTMTHGDRMPAEALQKMLWGFKGCRMMPRLFQNVGRDGPIAPLPQCEVPIRIAWSGDDRTLPFGRYGEPFMQRISAAELHIVAGAGHVPMYDATEAVLDHVLATTAQAERKRIAASV